MKQGQIIGEPIFSLTLRALMKAKGWTQETVAVAAEVSQASVNGWLTGSIPRADALHRLAKKLDVSMEYLLTGETAPVGMVMEQQLAYGRRSTEAALKLTEQARVALAALEKELKKI